MHIWNRPNIWRLKLALARFGGCHSIAGTPDQTAGLAPDDNELALISSPDPPARAIQMHRQWDLIKTPATAARVNFGSRPIEPARLSARAELYVNLGTAKFRFRANGNIRQFAKLMRLRHEGVAS